MGLAQGFEEEGETLALYTLTGSPLAFLQGLWSWSMDQATARLPLSDSTPLRLEKLGEKSGSPLWV